MPGSWESKPLRYGGTCDSCGSSIAKREVGWHDAVAKKVRCTECGPATTGSESASVTTNTAGKNPVGGSAALRMARARRDPKWTKGAAGEYFMNLSLHNHVKGDSVILTDREVPGTKSNIDHVVVASSGVWIVDSKIWKGKIEYKAPSMMGFTKKLYVDGKDRTSAVEAIFNQVIPVAQLLSDISIPIHPALVFIDGEWSHSSAARILANRPYQHLGVWISWPKSIWEKINEPGPLGVETVKRIGSQLDAALRPR